MGTKEEDIPRLVKQFGESNWYKHEVPQHSVDLPYDFYLARYPVTVAQFKAYLDEAKPKFDLERLGRYANHPVVYVSWHEALAYFGWLEGKLKTLSPERLAAANEPQEAIFWQGFVEGRLRLTLPSEAEWERAARGRDAWNFPWGEDFDPDSANTMRPGLTPPHRWAASRRAPARTASSTSSGNVWEWRAQPLRGISLSAGQGGTQKTRRPGSR